MKNKAVKKIIAVSAFALAVIGTTSGAGSFITSFYTYKGTNIRGVEATTTQSGYVYTICKAEDNNSYSYRKRGGYGKSYSYAEVVHDSGTLYRSASWSR